MSRQLTSRSTLENLKREAKRWLKELHANNAEARSRFDQAFPSAPTEPTLRDVQYALAREHGFSGWADVKRSVTGDSAAGKTRAELVHWFLENACPDHHVRGGPAHVMAQHTAMRILERHPEVARERIHTVVVCGDLPEVERLLAERGGAASEKNDLAASDRSGPGRAGDLFREIGPKGWEPLLYLCFARLPLRATNDDAVAIARALLDAGADPNAYFMAGDSRYTPLVGVIGEGEEDRPPHLQRDALVRLLLDRGAEPYDMQVAYNTHFHGDVLWLLQLIYEHSVRLGRKADWADPQWSMLDMGAYGSGARFFLDVAMKNNDRELAEWVLAHGASPNARPPQDPRMSKRSLHDEAVRNGFTEMANLLVRYGAAPSTVALEGIEAFTAACFRRDRDEAQSMLFTHPDYLRSAAPIFAATKRDRVEVVELLLDLGMSPDVEDETKQRPLHIAAYNDSLRAGGLLIGRGAEVDPIESAWGNTPLGAAVYSQSLRMIELLGRVSRDVWNLTFTGNVERLRDVMASEPQLGRVVGSGQSTPLMWLPDDEPPALEIIDLFLANGADPSIRNKDGHSAADRADKRGLFRAAELLRERESA
ncbi:MAG TPA: ankyrin repeat domain-containing protein [Gemmatimonadaceae bacterium]|nr:ankyrin repeat domain-containing protein [Gemmatimonadaceae bacterium]